MAEQHRRDQSTDPEAANPTLGQPHQYGVDPELNPFAGGTPIDVEPTLLDLGGGVLHSAGVLPPIIFAGGEGLPARPETGADIAYAAKQACNAIAEMFVSNGDPQAVTFPKCDNMAVISESLQLLTDTPLGLGYGPFPENVHKVWTRFMHETTDHYRAKSGLSVAELVPVRIKLPEWLKDNSAFDILQGCKLMDIEIEGPVTSVMARDVVSCRIRFKSDVGEKAEIGARAKRSSFIFEGGMQSRASFKDAANVSVHIHGAQSGIIGPMAVSEVICDGTWGGRFYYKGNGSSKGPNVLWSEQGSSGSNW
ncbi:MAG TPA: hypothetical protein VLF91_00385 [Candidatus Saccharimonadales bacterium]|nr:hypothetical protein [Candidatus Saccharimonadales bacterium]